MNLLLRLMLLLLRLPFRSKLQPFETSVLRMHVWPNDLDLQMHMNNGRFLSLMDLGRVDLMVRSGFLSEARKRRWFPLVGTTLVDYRRPLSVFEAYDLRTKIIGWDERWIYIEHQFVREGNVAARATLKTMIRSPDGAVAPAEILTVMGLDVVSPPLPDYAELMARTDRGKEII